MGVITTALSQLTVDVSLSGAPTRGDLLYANSTPQWTRLAVGAANRVLGSDGTDPAWVAQTFIDHGSITGLADDDHTQYALLAGRSGGQTLYGDTASGGNLTLGSTAHATKGKINFGTYSYFDSANQKFVTSDTDLSTVDANMLPPTAGDISCLGNGAVGFKATRCSSTGASAPQWALRKARGTVVSPSATNSGDSVGFLLFQAYETTTPSFRSISSIEGRTEEATTNTAAGGKLIFASTPIGSTTRTNRLGISANGNVVVGDIMSPAALATSATDGFIYIPTCAGAPSGTPTSYSPLSAVVLDTTNNRIYFYNPTGTPAWKYAALT